MRLRHIEIFHAVYTHGSVSAAARALNVSQPSVTKVLRHAEQQLGFPLFERVKGRLVPTEDAHTLFREVAEIQDRVHALRQAGQNLRGGRAGIVRASALPSLGLGAIPDAVARFVKRHPDVSFDIQTSHHDEMVRKLYDRETDVVIGYDVPRNAPVAHRWLGEGELVAFYREADLPDAPPRVPLEMLATLPFVSTIQSGPLGRMLTGELNRLDIDLNEIMSIRTFYVAAALVRSGVGFTIIDNLSAHAAMAPGLAFRPLQPSMTFDIQAVYLESRPPSQLMTAFLGDLSDILENL